MNSDATGVSPGTLTHSLQTHSRLKQAKKIENDMQFVEFILGHDYFAINLFHTREVISPPEITPLPNTPDYIRGIIDLRGSVTTIIDLKKLMNLSDENGMKNRSRIIILDNTQLQKPVGILVDDVASVSTYQSTEIDRTSTDSQQNSRNILGVIRKIQKNGDNESQKLILWLDIKAIRDSIESSL